MRKPMYENKNRVNIDRGVPRSEIFLVTKLFPPYYGYQSTLDLVPTFLEELGLNI